METFEHREDRPLPAESVGLIAMDLDGTLLRSDLTVGPESIEAIRAAVRQGVKVVLASGRGPSGLRQVYQGLGLDTLQMAHNGALIFHAHNGELFYHQPLEGSIAREVIQAVRRRAPKATVAVEVMDRRYIDGASSDSTALAKEPTIRGTPQASHALDAVLGRPVTKVMVMGDPEALGSVQMELGLHFARRIAFAFSHMRLLQVFHPSVDKAVALARIAAHYQVPRERVMAIGDAPNDVGMLRWVGLSVATENAWEPVRRIAHCIVPSNDHEGVAVAIRKYVLGG